MSKLEFGGIDLKDKMVQVTIEIYEKGEVTNGGFIRPAELIKSKRIAIKFGDEINSKRKEDTISVDLIAALEKFRKYFQDKTLVEQLEEST